MSIYGDLIEEQQQFEYWKQDWILSHLAYLPLSGEERAGIENELCSEMTSERLNELYWMVNNNLPDKIESGLNYGQGDILRKLDEINKDERK